jgi:hypothetical protein
VKREADHNPPYVAEVKNAWSYTYTPPYVFMARYLIKNGELLLYLGIILCTALNCG